jgi:ABC-2 type transport system permease protein
MTTVSTRPAQAAASLPGLPHLIGHQFRYDLRRYWRNAQSVFSTIILPVMFLVIFASVFRNNLARVPGGTEKYAAYMVPAIVAFGVLFAAFVNLTMTVVRNRETGIYKRRRAAPLPASAVITARALIAVLTAVAITVILVAIGWAAYGAALPARTAAVFVLDVLVGAAVFCCVGFAVATFIHNADAAQPVALAIALPLTFISGIFIPLAELPHWLADIATVFPVHALTDALLVVYNPHTVGAGLRWGDLAVLAAWGAVGLIIAVRRFKWLPRGG